MNEVVVVVDVDFCVSISPTFQQLHFVEYYDCRDIKKLTFDINHIVGLYFIDDDLRMYC